MTYLLCVLFLLNSFVFSTPSAPDLNPPLPLDQPALDTTQKKAKIQVALLLDTSNSMDGLIDQAKSQLWKMVNQLASSKKDGVSPDIELALFEYGNSGLDGQKGYIRLVTPLTGDLDEVSEKLFSLKTNGGDEYCGWVVQTATNDLEWSKDNDDLKLIIIAGNEPYDQGSVNYKESCKKAIAKGIMINTIHCGDYEEGIRTFWKDGADCADGKYMNINQDARVVHIPTPYDTTLNRLNTELNGTYIGFGSAGEAKMAKQAVQDSNAAEYGAANTRERAAAKASVAYKNTSWDLVDAEQEDDKILDKVKKEDLPEEMRNMSKEEQKTYIDAKSKQRTALQDEIRKYDALAKIYIAEQQKENAESLTLDNVMLGTMKDQAEKKNFKF